MIKYIVILFSHIFICIVIIANTRNTLTAQIKITHIITSAEDDWNIVYVECGSLSAKWKRLSVYIGLSKATIDGIRENRPWNSAECWGEALSQWIKQNYTTDRYGLPSWRSLLKAVAMVDNRLYKELAFKHPAGMSNLCIITISLIHACTV